jgi:hypothetical protein
MISKAEFGTFRNSQPYQEAALDVSQAISRALAELMKSQDITNNRASFLRGFIEGCTAILNWEPDFIIDTEEATDGLED